MVEEYRIRNNMLEANFRIGIDIGSTTVKIVLLDSSNSILFKRYERHMRDVWQTIVGLLECLYKASGDLSCHVMITGSGGLSLSAQIDVPFEQEVICCSNAIQMLIPDTDVAIELGGEDAKLTFFGESIEQRMNGVCAGGTGAFIDQMSILLNTDAEGLNKVASEHTIIYPIASRCGVFAKSDIQPLINDGAKISDLAASVFQSVVNQTISGLACGKLIKGKVAFLGGPLSFLSELRTRFKSTLELTDEQAIFPKNAELFPAIGAAMLAPNTRVFQISELLKIFKTLDCENSIKTHLEPLFINEDTYKAFTSRHNQNVVDYIDLSTVKGPLYLGIDVGSTTTKAIVIDAKENIAHMYYENNNGNSISTVGNMLKALYDKMPPNAYIANAVVTGYGEELIKKGYSVDCGEIETIAHYTAAEHFFPGVDFVLDIGGQDIKCLKIKNGAIFSITLNEACSSGCGSFLETFAKSVGMNAVDFANEGLYAKAPTDLGTRCTVFMNSKVKQAQKEGFSIGDISAGLSYSIIKNALYKVIKLHNTEDIGEKIVVQGGTFLSDSVLKSIENILGRDVMRPNISGHMGAFGAALIALNRSLPDSKSSILDPIAITSFSTNNTHTRCKGCENNCLLTINTFGNGERHITGNKCEKGEYVNNENDTKTGLNLYEWKRKRLFSEEYYAPIPADQAPRGVVGIPRVLNMYENYPFWFTFLTKLGFSVLLSGSSSKALYESGMNSITSDTVCYPAKLVHGHIRYLIDKRPHVVFYPNINFEIKEYDKTVKTKNHFNCPIVATYPEVIAANMGDEFDEHGILFMHPFLPYDDDNRLATRLYEEFLSYGVTHAEIINAVKAARKEDISFKKDVCNQGSFILEQIKKDGTKAIVLSGRPYHLDSEVNHGIDSLAEQLEFAVLSEDSVAYTMKTQSSLRVLDQWTYHSRLYRAAEFVGKQNEIELIQLTSFGCGLDAITSDQVEEILSSKNKLYTLLKIDEGSNLGAARIRIRSLKAAMEEREKNCIHNKDIPYLFNLKPFTKKMRKDMTLLIPQMSPLHFHFVESAFTASGYNVKLLPFIDTHTVEEGLRYVNNDACYPTILTIGQIIAFLKSGECDLNNTAILMWQTGGGCRASNYIALLRKALCDLDMSYIPVVSANIVGLEKTSGFRFTPLMAARAVMALVFGDTLMKVLYATRPYEIELDAADKLSKYHTNKFINEMPHMTWRKYQRLLTDLVHDFDKLPVYENPKPRVGIVGEIFVKFHPGANDNIVSIIESEGGEAVLLDFVDIFKYGLYNQNFNHEKLAGTKLSMIWNNFAIWLIELFQHPMQKALKKSNRFNVSIGISKIASKAEKITSLGNQCGEGWLLVGEMINLIDRSVHNIICIQPFACLANHVIGKGMLKQIRNYSSQSNIVAIDYDPGASYINQRNRIKLMMSTAHKKLELLTAEDESDNSHRDRDDANEQRDDKFAHPA